MWRLRREGNLNYLIKNTFMSKFQFCYIKSNCENYIFVNLTIAKVDNKSKEFFICIRVLQVVARGN